MKRIIISLILFMPTIFLLAQESEGNNKYRLYHNSYKNGKVAVFNENREEIIPYTRGYTSISSWQVEGRVGYYEVCNGKKHGICDVTGKEIIPCQYAGVGFSDDHFYVRRGNNKRDFDLTLDCEGKAVARLPLKKENKELYNTLAKQYKIKKAYVDNLGGSGTYICVVDKYDYKYLFDTSGNLLVEKFGTVYPIKPCEGHFDFDWIEATDGGLLINTNSGSYLVSAKNKSVNKLPGRIDFRGVDNNVNFIKIENRLYTHNGRAITPPNTISYSGHIHGDFVVYRKDVDGIEMYGGHNYRINSDTIPMVYSEMKCNNSLLSKDGFNCDIMVRQHFYQDFVKYTPGVTTTEEPQYSKAEKLLMNRKYDESLAAVQSKKDRGEEMDLVDGLIIFHDILEKYYPYGDRVSQLVKRVNNNNWNYYYHKDSESDLLGLDISGIKKVFEDMGQSYDNYQKIPNINISNYLTERKQKCEQVAHLLDSLENDFISGVEYIAQKTIAQEEYEEEQRQLAEQRRIEKQQMWAAFGAALAGAVASTATAISSSKSSGSSVSSAGSTRTYNSSSYTSSSSSRSSNESDSSGDSNKLTQSRKNLLEGWIRDWEKQIDEQKDILETQYKLKASGDSHASSLIRDCERRINKYTQKIEEAKAELKGDKEPGSTNPR